MKIPRPLPKGAVVGGIIAAGLILLALGYMVVVSPQNSKAASLAKQTADLESQISQRIAAAAAAKNVVVAPQIKVADVYKLAKAMPSAVDMPDILLQLDQVANEAGVQLASISPSQPVADPTSGQQAVTLSLSASGDFYSLTDLLDRLRNLVSVRDGALDATGRLFTINSVGFSPSTGHKLTASITLNTYVYGGPPAVAAPAAAPAPTDTSTDTTATDTTSTGSSSGPSAAGAGG